MDTSEIRKGLMRPGKSQRGLAAALGLDPSGVNRLLKGKRQLKASEVGRVQAYLDGQSDEPKGKDVAPEAPHASQRGTDDRIPVLGMAECGPDGVALWNGEIVDYIARPAYLAGAQKAYAVYIIGTSMEPRYHPGEIVHIHPGKPLTVGAYVLVQMHPKEDGAAPRAFLKRLKKNGPRVVLEQFEPPKTFSLAASEILSMHRVVGSSEG